MRAFTAFVLGLILGGVVVWAYLSGDQSNSRAYSRTGRQAPQENVSKTDKSQGSADAWPDRIQENIQGKMEALDLRTENVRDELAKTGQVVRRKASEWGAEITDAASDLAVTSAIEAKFAVDPDLSARKINVSTQDGKVALSGSVSSPELIGKAILMAMETKGVREVVYHLKVDAVSPIQ